MVAARRRACDRRRTAWSRFALRRSKVPIAPELLEQLDIRVGTITAVDEVPGSDKLMRLTVDLGDHSRTILAGIKQEWARESRNQKAES